MARVVFAACVVLMLVLGVRVAPAAAQLATITFPDTPVGSTATVQCPTTSVSLCFGSNCSGAGTVLSVNGPSLPFKIVSFDLLSQSQFSAGACAANPVGLPIGVGPGQVLAYQATFTPTSAGTFSGSATFSTGAGPAIVNFTGRGVSVNSRRTDKGFVGLQLSADTVVPGNSLTIQYRTRPGNLQGNVDLYFVVGLPTGDFLFFNDQGGLTAQIQPFQRNISVTDTTQTLFSGLIPADTTFGTYTLYMVLVYAGVPLDPNNVPPSLASALSQATLTFAPLSTAQQALLASRGRPDDIAVVWSPDAQQKRESWLYLSDPPIQVVFLNGVQQSQSSVSGGASGPKLDPALFTPQTTQNQLTAAFGSPTNVAAVDGAPQFQAVTYGNGLVVLFLNGQFSSATTTTP